VLQGGQVVLRAGDAGDIDALEAIFASPEVAAWWNRFDRERIEHAVLHEDDPGAAVHVIEVAGEVAGLIMSHEEQAPAYRSAGLDIAVGPRWHGTGVALDAIRTLARHLIDDKGHHRLTIDPAADNARAIAAYAKLGFQPVGLMREYEHGADGWHDALLMDLLARELR
jgi:aminoglycoside 6'-N-acetyltransferase